MTKKSRIKVWPGCTPSVANAIDNLCDQWGPYSTKSEKYSLLLLFENLIIPAWTTYLLSLPACHRGRIRSPDISLEKVAQFGGFCLVENVIQSWLRHFINANGEDDVEFKETLETLRVVASRCNTKRPYKLPSDRINRLYLDYCDFCGIPTELAAEKKGDIRPDYDREGAARLSAKYCWQHRPKFLDGSRNQEYLWVARHRLEFETELRRLNFQARSMNESSAATGDPDLDLFYFKVLAPLAAFTSDIGILRNEARRIVDQRVSDKKKRIVIMRAAQYSFSEIADKIGANSRQAVAKALGTVSKKYRFDLAEHVSSDRNIDNPTSFVDKTAPTENILVAYAHFTALLGSVITEALQDSDIIDILLNCDGTLWSDSRSVGMRKIGVVAAVNAEQIIQFASDNFPHEADSGKEIVMVELLFMNARLTGILPPITKNPLFTIRKEIH